MTADKQEALGAFNAPLAQEPGRRCALLGVAEAKRRMAARRHHMLIRFSKSARAAINMLVD